MFEHRSSSRLDGHLGFFLLVSVISYFLTSPSHGLSRGSTVAELTTFPLKDQLTYSGDPLVISCLATPVQPEVEVILLWAKNGSPVNNSESVHVRRSRTNTNELRVDVNISRLSSFHDGEWICVANSSFGIETRELSLHVVSERTAVCRDTLTETNKGRFVWPRTIGLSRISLPCSLQNRFSVETPSSTESGEMAWHECTAEGVWDNLDDSACPYVSVTTKILKEAAEVNLTTEHCTLKNVESLRNFTMNTTVISDPVDIVFISRAIAKCLRDVTSNPKTSRQIADVLIDIASIIQGLKDERLRREAQVSPLQRFTLSEIVHSVEQMPSKLPYFLHAGKSIAVSSQPVDAGSFSGIQCRLVEAAKGPVVKEIKCQAHDVFSADPNLVVPWTDSEPEERVLASISIQSDALSAGSSVFSGVHGWQQAVRSGDFRHQSRFDFLGFETAALFVDVESGVDEARGGTRGSSQNARRVVVGPVFGCKIYPFASTVLDVKAPIDVSVQLPFEISPSVARDLISQSDQERAAVTASKSSPSAAVRLPSLAGAIWNETVARWDVGARHCIVSGIRGQVVYLSCKRCGYFGISVDRKFFARLKPGEDGPQRLPHPLIIIGAGLCSGCLLVAVGIYAFAAKRLAMSTPVRHSLANTWISMNCLIAFYCCGIYQTGFPTACIGIGLLLHYFLQASMMWMRNSLSYLKTRVQMPYKAAHGSEDEAALAENNPTGFSEFPRGQSTVGHGKTLSQMYLLAYGVPLLICCVSAAVHVKEYGGPDVCALSIRPSIWAVFVPVGFTVVVLWVICMAIWCTLKCRMVPSGETVNVIPGDFDDNAGEDYLPQLYSHLIVFVLFIFTVVFGALAAADDVSIDAFDDDVSGSASDPLRVTWAVLFAVSSFALGIFVLIRFAFQKVDFGVVFPLEISGVKPNAGSPAASLLGPVAPQMPSTTAVTGMAVQPVNPPASSLVASTEEPGQVAAALNGSLSSSRAGALPNALIGPQPVLLTRSMASGDGFVAPMVTSQVVGAVGPQMPVVMQGAVATVAAAPMFYDPQQMSVARRFFEKQRKKQNKQQFAQAVGAAVAGSGADSWVEQPRRHTGRHLPLRELDHRYPASHHDYLGHHNYLTGPSSRYGGSGSEIYLGAGFCDNDGDETESHFTSVSHQRPGQSFRMAKWSDSEVSVPCRSRHARRSGRTQLRDEDPRGEHGYGRKYARDHGSAHGGSSRGSRWARRQHKSDSRGGGMEMESLVGHQLKARSPAINPHQPQRVVIGQESSGQIVGMLGMGMLRQNAPASVAASSSTMAPHSDVLLPGVDVDSEDGLSLMRPAHARHLARESSSKVSSSGSRSGHDVVQPDGRRERDRRERHRRRNRRSEEGPDATELPALSVVSDATCATFNSSNVAASRIRSLEAVDAAEDDGRHDESEYAVHEIDEESRSRSPSLSSSSSCSRSERPQRNGNLKGRTETCI